MEVENLEKTKQQLLQLRKEILQGARDAQRESLNLGQDGVADIGDMSSTSYQLDVIRSLGETQRARIRDIDAALDRIDQGVYGICAACEEPIAPRRLEVRPFSRYCIDCKLDIEKFGE